MAASVSFAVSTAVAPPAEASYPILLGASGYAAELQAQIGVPLARHFFGQLNGRVPDGRLVNMKPQRDPRRAQWLRDAYVWLKANRDYIRGAFYYNTSDARPGCYWRLTTAGEISAFKTMASDSAFGS